jgi:hypothetical protein
VNYKFGGASLKIFACQKRPEIARRRRRADPNIMCWRPFAGCLRAGVLIRGGVISDDDPNTNVFGARSASRVRRSTIMPTRCEGKSRGECLSYGSTSDTTPADNHVLRIGDRCRGGEFRA